MARPRSGAPAPWAREGRFFLLAGLLAGLAVGCSGGATNDTLGEARVPDLDAGGATADPPDAAPDAEDPAVAGDPARLLPPAPPAIAPEIPDVSAMDRDGDRVEDVLADEVAALEAKRDAAQSPEDAR